MFWHFRTTKRTPHRIEIFVDKIEQLFNSMDPSPFQERDLDHDAEEFMVSWMREFPLHDPVDLVIYLNQQPTGHSDLRKMVETAVHNYFAYRAKLKWLDFRRLLKEGRTSLIIGLTFLGACLVTRELLRQLQPGTLQVIARESLIIAGWVAMWQPIQIFLYEWWPLLRIGRLYEKMSRMRVELQKPAG
jgi:hypothetical protein